MGKRVIMKKIFLLTNSRSGSHYICNLFYDNLDIPDVLPELLHVEHWLNSPIKNRLQRTLNRYNLEGMDIKSSMIHILEKTKNYIVKYSTAYETLSPSIIKEIAELNNAKFCFLYRENVLEVFLSNIIVDNFGYLDSPVRLSQIKNLKNFNNAAARTLWNYNVLNNTYDIFQPCIDHIVRYEDFKNDKNDLRLIGVDVDSTVFNTQKVVHQKIKDYILRKYNIKNILQEQIENSNVKNIDNDFKYSPFN
jgi:hypothetical protein